jgi:hypothetical protein
VVLSHAGVYTKAGTSADFLEWANGSDLRLLMGLVLAFPRDKDEDISAFGSRLVIEGLQIYGTDDGKEPRLLLSAETMSVESLSDEIGFSGLTIQPNLTERITCPQSATWSPAKRMMYFPKGCLVNGKPCAMKYWAGGDNRGHAQRQFGASRDVASGAQYAGLSLPSGERIGPEEIQKLIRNKDRKALQNILAQYLVLNPKAFQSGGLAPLLFMGGGFQLGQFTPGPFVAGSAY